MQVFNVEILPSGIGSTHHITRSNTHSAILAIGVASWMLKRRDGVLALRIQIVGLLLLKGIDGAWYLILQAHYALLVVKWLDPVLREICRLGDDGCSIRYSSDVGLLGCRSSNQLLLWSSLRLERLLWGLVAHLWWRLLLSWFLLRIGSGIDEVFVLRL